MNLRLQGMISYWDGIQEGIGIRNLEESQCKNNSYLRPTKWEVEITVIISNRRNMSKKYLIRGSRNI